MSSVPRRYRTFWHRVAAAYVDVLVFVPLSSLDDWISYHASYGAQAMSFVVYSLALPVYSIALHGLSGQTIGKWALGLRVVDVRGGPLSLTQAVRREAINLPFVAWSIAAWFGEIELMVFGGLVSLIVFFLELLSTLTNSKRRALHDFIAGSAVVRVGVDEEHEQVSVLTLLDPSGDIEEGPPVRLADGRYACFACGAQASFGASQCRACEQLFDYASTNDGSPPLETPLPREGGQFASGETFAPEGGHEVGVVEASAISDSWGDRWVRRSPRLHGLLFAATGASGLALHFLKDPSWRHYWVGTIAASVLSALGFWCLATDRSPLRDLSAAPAWWKRGVIIACVLGVVAVLWSSWHNLGRW